MEVKFDFEIGQKVKHVGNGKEGSVSTCALDDKGLIYYVEFPEKHTSNHWFRKELLTDVE